MSLIQRIGAGLFLVGGVFASQADADWTNSGCSDCGIGVPAIDNGMGHDRRWGPRLKYRSSARVVGPLGAPMVGAPMMGPMPALGSGLADCQCGPMMGPMLPSFAPMMNWNPLCAPMPNCAPICPTAPLIDCAPAPAPMIVPQTTMQPVIETQMCPQPVTTYCDVPKTVMRREAVQVQVPKTTYRQVTVDEGCYQQVWVPKMVTKNIPQTVMQTQVQYRDVPTTVTERVPRTTTQWVPKQVVRHVPTTSQGQCFGAPASGLYPTVTPTEVTPVPESYNPTPLNPVPVPMGDSATAPASPPKTSQLPEWQKVRQRQIEQQNYEYETQDAGLRVPKAAGRFSSSKR